MPHSLVTLANPGVSDWHILHPGASRRNGSIRAGFKDSSVDKGSTESPAPDMSTHWFGVGRDLKDYGDLPLDQVGQGPTQPGLEPSQGWGSSSSSGQTVPVPHHPLSTEFLPKAQPKSLLS